MIGVICGIQNEHAQAKKLFEKALKANNRDVWIHFNLVKSLIELGEISEAWTNKNIILCKLRRFDETEKNTLKYPLDERY